MWNVIFGRGVVVGGGLGFGVVRLEHASEKIQITKWIKKMAAKPQNHLITNQSTHNLVI